MAGNPITTATMLWNQTAGSRYGIKNWGKQGSALGRKYTFIINGQWKDLDAVAEKIITLGGYELTNFLQDFSQVSGELKAIVIPPSVTAIARTPDLTGKGEGDKAELTLTFEEGLQEGTGGMTGADASLIGPSQTDAEAFLTSASTRVPADTSYRLVFEPNDVDLGYGLPFRGTGTEGEGYKWDLTLKLSETQQTYEFSTKRRPLYDKVDGTTPTTVPANQLDDLLNGLGYDPENLSLLALTNIWRDGAATEQQRGAIFEFLNDEDDGGGTATVEFVKRILRGETSYRFWVPHVSAIRRYRNPPILPGSFPLPGQISEAGTNGAPPPWCNAPLSMFVGGEDAPEKLRYTYWSSGPQVEHTGEFWTVEVQWSGFVDIDDELYGDPTATDDDV